MASSNILLILFSISIMLYMAYGQGHDYLKKVCSVTRYQSLCIHSLSHFSSPASHSTSGWARAAVSVTLAETQEAGQYLVKLKTGGGGARMRGRARIALSDCVECFSDAVLLLHSALGEMRSLERETFASQISNVETWLSAALTNQNTCIDGFQEFKVGPQVRMITSKVLNTTHFTSNALALVNKLASSGQSG
ncbi:Pectinesterase protein [Dioscorea alata]|uniref:Pectinesterase protein n=1 Tax=Dioscorea alata TaxID=55571 RepID=A0ACB7V0H8_DIOAL|nr:Pectinesterase protein [Dioscorea alata]